MQKVTAVLTKSNSHSRILIFKSCSFKQVTISTTIKCGGSPHTALLSTNKAPAKLSRLPADLVGQYCLGSHCSSPLAQSGMHIHLITSKGPQPFNEHYCACFDSTACWRNYYLSMVKRSSICNLPTTSGREKRRKIRKIVWEKLQTEWRNCKQRMKISYYSEFLNNAVKS